MFMTEERQPSTLSQLPSPPARLSLQSDHREEQEDGAAGDDWRDHTAPTAASTAHGHSDNVQIDKSEGSLTRRRSGRRVSSVPSPVRAAGQHGQGSVAQVEARGASGQPPGGTAVQRPSPLLTNDFADEVTTGTGRSGRWLPAFHGSASRPVTPISCPRSSATASSSDEAEAEAAPAPRPRFHDPPITPAPVRPPLTRWQRLKYQVANKPPISWVAWKSDQQLQKDLLRALTSDDEAAISEYRLTVKRSFRNCLFVEMVVASTVFAAIITLWSSSQYILLLWLVVIVGAVVVNQYMRMRRIMNIVDNQELHAAYVRELSLRLYGGLYEQMVSSLERRYSDDPTYLPDPPPVYNTATAVPPAYELSPAQKPNVDADDLADGIIPTVDMPRRPEATALRLSRTPLIPFPVLEQPSECHGVSRESVQHESIGVGREARSSGSRVATPPHLEMPFFTGGLTERTPILYHQQQPCTSLGMVAMRSTSPSSPGTIRTPSIAEKSGASALTNTVS